MSTSATTATHDAIVIGGGPAGSAAAGLLAKAGFDVLLLEKEQFPRYHIGESLIPGLNSVIDELGAREAIEAANFTSKPGISLLWGGEGKLWSIAFGESGPYEYTWQVKRADFDLILLEHARKLGALVVEHATVRDILTEGDRVTGVTYSLGKGAEPVSAKAHFVIDASGQSKIIPRKFDLVEYHDDLKNLAVWSYYQGGTSVPDAPKGNILVENHPDGWLWVIPFSDGSKSVGFVGPNDAVASDKRPPIELLEEQISTSQIAKSMLEGTTRVADCRTAKDWSYTCRSFSGPGYILVGDSAAFIDPLFSTGVTLAMKGASSAAATVAASLKQPDREEEFRREYDTGLGEFLDSVLSFVRFFYDASRDVEAYWAKAKTLVDPIGLMTDRQDFIVMVSGLNAELPVMQPHLDAAPDGVAEGRNAHSRNRGDEWAHVSTVTEK
ncbi:NAD(P)/FAD-dependent oxidoreductase [Dietzia timorensis]|uniref:NAD(P)/FAD-dependent oxidoreductase n=1 Tax=Dietzia timorensis TaxID=499555 RepID=UPI00082C9AC8|nr:tryptophan 7-halogenase [Dietzia timorensis]